MNPRAAVALLALCACAWACDRNADKPTPSAVRSAALVKSAPESTGAPPALVKSAPESTGTPPVSATVQPPTAPKVAVEKRPRLLALGFSFTQTYREKRFAWRQVEGLSWQAATESSPPLPAEPAVEAKGCPAGMLRVSGGLLLDARSRETTDAVQLLQNRACTHFLTASRGTYALCSSFDRARWLELSKDLPRKRLDFCIDRYEFPNAYGEAPLVVVTFSEAKRFCEKLDKRICTESEWTLACEGEEGKPYPYGYERDKSACRIDILKAGAPKNTFSPRTIRRTARGIDFAWHGKRSGESPRCKSPYGVMDMTGNVDEWTSSVRRGGYPMIMKGGHWGPARQRCRPQTRGHGPYYVRYDQGFRCCANLK